MNPIVEEKYSISKLYSKGFIPDFDNNILMEMYCDTLLWKRYSVSWKLNHLLNLLLYKLFC